MTSKGALQTTIVLPLLANVTLTPLFYEPKLQSSQQAGSIRGGWGRQKSEVYIHCMKLRILLLTFWL